MTPEQLAQLAQSLKDNEAFQMVLESQRSSALERLATMPRSDEQAFYAAQAVVAFSLLVLVLLFRPTGILGRPEVKKV